MLALTREFMLVTLGTNCNRYLRSDHLREFKVLLVVGPGLITPDAQHPESLVGSGQR